GRQLAGEPRPPVRIVTLGERETFILEIDGGAIRSERFVRALNDHLVGVIEDGAPPAGGVGEQRRARLFVDRHLLHLPDAIERRERSAPAPSTPDPPGVVAVQAYEPQTKYDLRNKRDPVGPDAKEEWRL